MQNVVITGASSGIGAATALHLDQQGARVFAGVENEGDGATALAGASSRLQRITLDVSDDASIAAAFETIRSQVGDAGLDGVVNNAGIGYAAPLELLPREDFRRLLDVNVLGQVAVTQAALPLIRLGHGRVVIVGSVGGILASQFAGAYHASKFALEAIADVWRQELDPDDVPVILIEPSTIATPIWDKAIAYLDQLTASDDKRLKRYRERLTSFRETLHSADEHGKAPKDVAEVIAEALTTKKPDTRYVVGADGKLATALRPLIPDRIADKLAERTTA
ncbi:SDR family NAD(P)-dependent oxidoreductase [Solirubrobacter phytolaccae]|uniref:SDR family NAD(P)-dependent oxidoreductase n=1 Tax=Solirubrobacter phytolaccae TaxID=1404360 RepID=A0A9X3N7U2_9ACTN|nr:SDR family NAD(P)-dependent oxidoreductase [Solirubrobacter phytolaccae]MDA0180060.1 SDR family NAD(P)-dependent oxidoreductase [Solirubrobacter phytolaccae]